jgi:hypothetical protein
MFFATDRPRIVIDSKREIVIGEVSHVENPNDELGRWKHGPVRRSRKTPEIKVKEE